MASKKYNEKEICQLLLQHGADIYAEDFSGNTALTLSRRSHSLSKYLTICYAFLN